MPCNKGSESTKRIILFNGPPGCGKDTAANIINKHLSALAFQYKMAKPLKEACHNLLGLQGTLEELEPLKELPIKFLVSGSNFIPKSEIHLMLHTAIFRALEDQKLIKYPEDQSIPLVGEMTLRQFYIHISENVMKPMFGDDIFGRLAVENLRQCHHAVATVSDTGFEKEALPIIEYFGKDHVCLVRLHREGKTFAGDSRGYVNLPVGITLDVENNSQIEIFEKDLWRRISKNFLVGMF